MKRIFTNTCRSDGFGSQYMGIMCDITYAGINDLEFYYTPFTKMWHEITDPEYLKKKENLIHLIDYYSVNKDLGFQRSCATDDRLFFNEIDRCIEHSSFQKIKELFFSDKNKNQYFDNRNINIAIHIRRDQEIEGAQGKHFHFTDKIYLKMIEKLREKYSGDSPLIHIYSIGKQEEFERVYSAPDVVLHINDSIEDTFSSFALADVLLISVSGFSYAAGLLTDGIVYEIPWWSPSRSHWLDWQTLYPLNLSRFPMSSQGRNILVDI